LIIYIIIIALSTAMVNVNIFAGDPSAILKLSIGQQVLNTLLIGIPSYFFYAIFASGLTAAYVEIKTMKGGAASVGDIFS